MSLKQKTARIVTQDRYGAFAEAEVCGPHNAPANGRRITAPMSRAMKDAGYLAETIRQHMREKAFEDDLWLM